jgi:phosphatidate cytidylyltransferase
MKLLGLFGGVLTMLIGISLFFMFATKDSTNDSLFAIIFGMAIVTLLLLVPLMFICELYRKSTTPIANIGSTIMGMLYVAMPLSLLILIPALLGTSSGGWNPWIVLFYIFIIWANDVFAYLFGITLGRHRLFERISPKKSWEGFFGGLIGAMAMGYVASLVLDTEPVVWIGMALVAAIAGVFGDLVESLFKRSVDVKDSGNFIPGHGGWLDRFDALIFSAPFAFVYVLFVTLIL